MLYFYSKWTIGNKMLYIEYTFDWGAFELNRTCSTGRNSFKIKAMYMINNQVDYCDGLLCDCATLLMGHRWGQASRFILGSRQNKAGNPSGDSSVRTDLLQIVMQILNAEKNSESKHSKWWSGAYVCECKAFFIRTSDSEARQFYLRQQNLGRCSILPQKHFSDGLF